MSDFKLGTVTELFATVNTAKVKFDGEDVVSEKQYSYLDNYVPAVNDRVVLASVAGTYIILGRIAYNSAPTSRANDLKVTGKVGLFGSTPVTKTPVAQLSSSSPTSYNDSSADSTYSTNEVNLMNHMKSDVYSLWLKLYSVIGALRNMGAI